MTEMKPCPFCNHKHKYSPMISQEYEYIERSHQGKEVFILWYQIVCLKCKARTGTYHTQEEAIEAWNRRVPNDDK